MISPVQNKEWTIEIERDSQPGRPTFVATLVFRLNTQNGVVTGQVWDGVERRLLSSVTGTHKPLPGADSWFMALEFKWGDTNVALSGVTVETPETTLFRGRFRASGTSTKDTEENPVVVTPPLMVPGDGDTGSGTGQQT